jgi:hypothetical protein
MLDTRADRKVLNVLGVLILIRGDHLAPLLALVATKLSKPLAQSGGSLLPATHPPADPIR